MKYQKEKRWDMRSLSFFFWIMARVTFCLPFVTRLSRFFNRHGLLTGYNSLLARAACFTSRDAVLYWMATLLKKALNEKVKSMEAFISFDISILWDRLFALSLSANLSQATLLCIILTSWYWLHRTPAFYLLKPFTVGQIVKFSVGRWGVQSTNGSFLAHKKLS